jgi:hypothetical protein
MELAMIFLVMMVPALVIDLTSTDSDQTPPLSLDEDSDRPPPLSLDEEPVRPPTSANDDDHAIDLTSADEMISTPHPRVEPTWAKLFQREEVRMFIEDARGADHHGSAGTGPDKN